MEQKEPIQLLRTPEQEPTAKLFSSILDKHLYAVNKEIDSYISESGLALEWRFYKDGKAWLGKVTYKKKTVVWLSVWNEFIKAGFYFTEKTRSGILDLDIDENIKSSFSTTKPIGKLIPLILDIKNEEELAYFRKIICYKKNLK